MSGSKRKIPKQTDQIIDAIDQIIDAIGEELLALILLALVCGGVLVFLMIGGC